MARMTVLRRADNLAKVPTTPPDRCHQLKANRDEQYAVDLYGPWRLVFEPDHDPIPRKSDGGIDKEQVISITILCVKNYH